MFERRNYTTGICQKRETRTTSLKKLVRQTLTFATGLFPEEVSRVLRKSLLSPGGAKQCFLTDKYKPENSKYFWEIVL